MASDTLHANVNALVEQLKASTIETVRSTVRLCNARQPINRLAGAVLRSVWELLPFNDRIAISHVCYAWRALALDTPQLWSRINISSRWKDVCGLYGSDYCEHAYCELSSECDCSCCSISTDPRYRDVAPQSNLKALAPLLARSAPLPFQLHLTFTTRRIHGNTLDILKKRLHPHVARMSSLTVDALDHREWLCIWGDLPSAPLLHTLMLSQSDDYFDLSEYHSARYENRRDWDEEASDSDRCAATEPVPPTGSFDYHLPELLKLDSIFPSSNLAQASFPALKHLVLPCEIPFLSASDFPRVLRSVEQFSCVPRTHWQISNIFCLFPNVATLEVDLGMWCASPASRPLRNTQSTPNELTALSHLHLRNVPSTWSRHDFALSGLPPFARISSLHVQYRRDADPNPSTFLTDVEGASTITYHRDIGSDLVHLRVIAEHARRVTSITTSSRAGTSQSRLSFSPLRCAQHLRVVAIDISRWNALLRCVLLFRSFATPNLEVLHFRVLPGEWLVQPLAKPHAGRLPDLDVVRVSCDKIDPVPIPVTVIIALLDTLAVRVRRLELSNVVVVDEGGMVSIQKRVDVLSCNY